MVMDLRDEANVMTGPETGSKSVDRETLYAEIWTTPGTQLAQKYGVSDVAIGQACRRHVSPRPPPGYWAMRRHGHEVERPRLSRMAHHGWSAARAPRSDSRSPSVK